MEKGSKMCPKIYQGTLPVDLVEVSSIAAVAEARCARALLGNPA